MILSTPYVLSLMGQHHSGKHTASKGDAAPSVSRLRDGAALMQTLPPVILSSLFDGIFCLYVVLYTIAFQTA